MDWILFLNLGGASLRASPFLGPKLVIHYQSYSTFPAIHCCVCDEFCFHVGNAQYCRDHSPLYSITNDSIPMTAKPIVWRDWACPFCLRIHSYQSNFCYCDKWRDKMAEKKDEPYSYSCPPEFPLCVGQLVGIMTNTPTRLYLKERGYDEEQQKKFMASLKELSGVFYI